MGRLALLCLVALVLLPGCKGGEPLATLPAGEAAGGPRKVKTVQARVDKTSDQIKATGTTAPLSSTKIMPLVPGMITRLPVKEGEPLRRGQTLAVIDQRGYHLTVRQAEAAVAMAKVGLDAAQREKVRFEKLLKDDATAKAQFDQVMDRFRGAEAGMNQALVARDMAKKALGDTVLRAPYDGVVVKRLASVGDYATSMPPTVILSIMDIHVLELKFSLPEPELARISVGARVEARLGSIDRTLTASVSRINRSVDMMTRSFEVIVEVPNPDLSLKPGLFADVVVHTGKPRSRLVVPATAVVDEGAGVFSVFTAQNGLARRTEVKVVTADQERSEVLSGLSGDEWIIVDPSGLQAGDAVQAEPLGEKASLAESAR